MKGSNQVQPEQKQGKSRYGDLPCFRGRERKGFSKFSLLPAI